MAEFAINNAWNASTGSLPFYLNNGPHPRVPSNGSPCDPEKITGLTRFTRSIADAIQRAKCSLEEARGRMRQVANQTRREMTFHIGDRVLLGTRRVCTSVSRCQARGNWFPDSWVR